MINMKNVKIRSLKLVAILACVTGLSACAISQNSTYEVGGIEISDPYEGWNRSIFAFNNAVDDVVITPVAKGYRAITPKPARTGLRNVLRTLRAPVNLGNQLLQGDLKGSGNVIKRTIINVMLSGGLVDFAGHEGIEYEYEDFGQTLAVWGVGHGPYVMAPLLGPSSLRDYTGYAVDGFASPLRWYAMNINEQHIYYTKVGLDYLDLRESLLDILEEIEASSIDYYAATRSIYYQRRQALVEDRSNNVQNSNIEQDYPDFEDFEDF